MPDQLQFLHISDLHINLKKNFDRSLVLDPLLQRIAKDRQDGLEPELVLVTGDIANRGVQNEYDEAKRFFADLLEQLELPPERLFLVPGNHDVNRKIYRPKDIPVYEDMEELNAELENPHYRADLVKGMADYFAFARGNYPHLDSKLPDLIPFVASHHAQCHRRIGLVGLNSAWMCRKSPDREEVAIGEYQVNSAMAELREQGAHDLVLVLFHHPLDWLWPRDRELCKSRYFDNKILLAGHLHDAEGIYNMGLHGAFYRFQAGGAYIGSESNWPSRYHYLTIDWDAMKVRLDFRKFAKTTKRWVLDGDKGDDGVATFPLTIKPTTKKPHPSPSPKTSEHTATLNNLRKRYLGFIEREFSDIKLKGISKGILTPIPLREIYTDLMFLPEQVAGEAGGQPGNAPDKALAGLREERDKQIPLRDILKSQYVVITAGPGAGKSTILKRIALAFHSGEQEEFGCPADALPIFLPIVRYADNCRTRKEHGNSCKSLLEYLCNYYQELYATDLTGLFKHYLEAGKALLLFDGLDEVVNEQERVNMVEAVRRFLQSDLVHPDNRCLVTCRTASYTMASRIEPVNGREFQQVHAQPFGLESIGAFLFAWYRWYEREVNKRLDFASLAAKDRDRMTGIIKGDGRLADIATNPLMLTILASIEHDCGGRLPSTKPELYAECLNKLAGMWDLVRSQMATDEARPKHWQLAKYKVDADFIVEHLGPVAMSMQRQAQLQIEEQDLRRALTTNLLARTRDDQTLARQYADNFLDILRRQSGLIREATTDVFEFIHASFREYLAARWLADCSANRLADIGDEGLFTPEWREVVFLTAGSLKLRDTGEFLASIMARREHDPENVNLAGTCAADIGEAKVPPLFLEELHEKLTGVAFGDYPPRQRVIAGEAIGWLGDRRDLREFVPIEGGDYVLSELGKRRLDAFELGRFPVTNGWFEEFVEQGGYDDEALWSQDGLKWLQNTQIKAPRWWYDRKWRCPIAPVVGVCWYEADAFCRWLTKQGGGYRYSLPTEAQWQAAAVGKEGREYPWGGEWREGAANIEDVRIERTSPVGVFPQGHTPRTDLVDLAGNVWEWTRSAYHGFEELVDFEFDEELHRLLYVERNVEAYLEVWGDKNRVLPVLRGGSWLNGRDSSRCAARFWYFPILRDLDRGFRCSRAVL